jgi:hypothetical protein
MGAGLVHHSLRWLSPHHSQHQQPGSHVACSVSVADKASAAPAAPTPQAAPPLAPPPEPTDRVSLNQHIREGHFESALVNLQARKADEGQASIASALPPVDASATADVTIVGAGPAGLFLAAELGKRGLKVNVLGEHFLPIGGAGGDDALRAACRRTLAPCKQWC